MIGRAFVPTDNPRYEAICDRARASDPAQSKFDDKRPGIWVPLSWLDEAGKRSGVR